MAMVLGSLLATIGLLLLALRFMRRLPGNGAGGGRLPLRVLQRVSTGPRQGVSLLRVGCRVLVIAQSEGRTAMLTELEGPDLVESLAGDEAPVRVSRRVRARPWGVLKRLALAALLVSAPGRVVRAQGITAPAPVAPAQQAQTPPAAGQLTVNGPTIPSVEFTVGSGDDALHLSGTVGVVVLMGAMTLLPALFMLMTSFTRILIVLHFLRSALGAQTTPPTQLLVAIAILLTGAVMRPVIQQANQDALQPYFAGEITQAEAYGKALTPFREFMMANTRDQDLGVFTELNGVADQVETYDDIPTVTVVSAFVTSELRTAFQMGFVIFLPFIVVDLIVASVLMSMGMFMLPPVMVSLPFKLLLFVLADGWSLVIQNVATSFNF